MQNQQSLLFTFIVVDSGVRFCTFTHGFVFNNSKHAIFDTPVEQTLLGNLLSVRGNDRVSIYFIYRLLFPSIPTHRWIHGFPSRILRHLFTSALACLPRRTKSCHLRHYFMFNATVTILLLLSVPSVSKNVKIRSPFI